MFYTVYKITNKINNKFYIGKHQTNKLDDGYMGSGKLIRRAIVKHGIENFTKEILYIFDNEEDMNKKEKEMVVISENSYNLCDGGKGGFGYINSNEELRIEKNKKARQTTDKILLEKYGVKNPFQLEHIKRETSERNKKLHKEGKMKAPDWSGKKHTEESKQKMRKSKNIGINNSQYGTCWITNGQENKKIKKEELVIWLNQGYYKGRI
ncbi:grpIintron_endo, group I intron endonuclease [uncultured Caudovirales phage]|uniref:GrpIintron_endo, group I intron endonuclease n=1 Tax=uncultured Caudovirales phage TaxID=2100421 RepID=A0A6J5NZ00_9CAUD|nr:grpIintron_endo, group I intron endonuclease [uncultured Caudovirales phage]